MKNRLICLALCFVMVLSVVLTGCGEKSDDDVKQDITEAASESAMTLTMWVVSKEAVNEATAKIINDELNSISKAKFKTQLSVKFFTPEQYQAQLGSTIVANQNMAPSIETTAAATGEDAVITDATRVNEYGFVEIVYPPEEANQVDIIYIAGEEMFDSYVANGWLAALDEELASGSKKLTEYVSNSLLSAIKQEGVTYAIPNNNVIGEYTYMLLDKELIDKYCQQGYVQKGMIDGFANDYLYDFLDQVYELEPSESVIPVDATYEECLDMLAHYWSIDPETYDMLDGFSAFGYHYTDMTELSRGSIVMGYQSLFANEEFAKDFLALNRFRMNGYYGDAETTGKKAAVSFVKGDINTIKQYEDDYYSVIVKYPTASVADVYSNMFGIYARTKSVSRSMEILTYLNTNAEFRNILQYGKEGVHYELNKEADGSVTLERDANNRYIMDIYATGNAFIAYPEPTMDQDIWENGKIQNRTSLVDPLLDFDFASFAQSTASDSASSIKVDAKKGYALQYTNGYSKDALSQNADLKAWLDECDAAGKGTYVFKSSQNSGQYLISDYYIYNNELTSNMKFSVSAEDVLEVSTTTNNKGEEVTTEKQVGVNLSFDFVEDGTTNKAGYTISRVQLQNRRSNYKVGVAYTYNEEETDADVTSQSGLIDFDPLKTNEYTVEVYDNLSKSAIRHNQAVIEWINSCKETKGVSQTNVLAYEGVEDGKNVYTYVVLRNGLTYVTDMQVVPTGDMKAPELVFDFSDEGLELLLEPEDEEQVPEASYVLYYVRVTTAADVSVTYSTTYKGEAELEKDGKTEKKINTTKTQVDPDFVRWGELDTELVKLLYSLNVSINEIIANCKTYEELEMIVADLGVMLSTDKEAIPVLSRIQSDAVKALIPNQNFLTTLHERMMDAVNDQPQSAPVDENSGEELLYDGKEEYVCYMSPCAVYYAWLDSYGFLPASAKK